jgi:PAS domain S-box-containing protein
MPERIAASERFHFFGLFGLLSASALLVTLSVVAFNLLAHVSKLKMAPNDNIHWGLVELSSENSRFELALAETSTDDKDWVELEKRLNILYSRADLIRTAGAYEFVRNSPVLAPMLAKVSEHIESYAAVLDQPDLPRPEKLSRLKALVPETRATVRELGVGALGEAAKISDKVRSDLRSFIQLIGIVGILLVGMLVALIIFYYTQGRRLRAREGDLIESRERMSATSRVSIDAVVVADRELRIADFNDSAIACFGIERQLALGSDMIDLLFAPHHRRQLRTSILKLLNGPEDYIGNLIEVDALHADGREIPMEMSLGVAQTLNGPIAIAFLRDITQRRGSELALRKALEDAREAELAKSRFLAIMSHEIRTPINGIIGALELLHGTDLTSVQSNHVRLAFQSGEALLSIIRNILDISKMDVAGIELQTAALSLESLCRSAAEVAESGQSDRENRMQINIAPDVPRYVVADGDRLQQVLLNLLNNAQKFTLRGDIHLNVTKAGGTGNQPLIEFSVVDTGIGFDDKKTGNLFKEFSTLDNTNQRKTGGTGLGLAISKRLVMAMGGEIGAHGEKGLGSRFWFRVTLPVASQPALESPALVSARSNRHIKVLLVDDNITNLVVTKERLASAGFEVDTASGGLEGVAMGTKNVYDVILMDISMPDVDGLEATRRLRASGMPSGQVPIIALTAAAMRENVNSALAAGMDGFLSKPMRRAALIAEIERLVSTRQQKSSEGGLDDKVLKDLEGEVGQDAMRRAMLAFGTELQKHQASLARVRDNEDLRLFERVCHTLAGSASALGAMELARLANELEAGCKAQLASQSMSRTPELISAIGQAQAAIRERFAPADTLAQ